MAGTATTAAAGALPIASEAIELREADLRRMFPEARQDYITALMLGVPMLERHGILANRRRWCAFIANAATETGGLTIVRENMNYSAKNLLSVWPKRYPPTLTGRAKANNHAKKGAKFIACYNYGFRLGNRGRDTDDGWDFRGALALQHTGRSMALWLQGKTGKPWADQPSLFDQVMGCVEPACLVWTSQDLGNLNTWADRGQFRATCNGINRGNPRSSLNPIGWDHRQNWHRKALAIWGDEAPMADGLLYEGMPGPSTIVRHYQQVLHDLGYHHVGIIDGRYGDNTADAVASFQRVNGLKIDGVIGPQTRAALDSDEALPKPVTVERAEATAGDLAATSTTVQNARQGQGIAQFLGGLSFLAMLKGVADQIAAVREVIEPLSGHITWLFSYWPIGLLGVALILYGQFGGIITARLRDFVTGRHTG